MALLPLLPNPVLILNDLVCMDTERQENKLGFVQFKMTTEHRQKGKQFVCALSPREKQKERDLFLPSSQSSQLNWDRAAATCRDRSWEFGMRLCMSTHLQTRGLPQLWRHNQET
jgi:hypothetical protein